MIKDVCLDIYIKEQSDVLTPGESGIPYEKVGGLNYTPIGDRSVHGLGFI